ncbi:hypothetical protein BDR26DRAFT_850830 [Obelidium mucronatum]|nr:hypothetical protein BDR26DRAFT_850830 [Obelidium mucronatum]
MLSFGHKHKDKHKQPKPGPKQQHQGVRNDRMQLGNSRPQIGAPPNPAVALSPVGDEDTRAARIRRRIGKEQPASRFNVAAISPGVRHDLKKDIGETNPEFVSDLIEIILQDQTKLPTPKDFTSAYGLGLWESNIRKPLQHVLADCLHHQHLSSSASCVIPDDVHFKVVEVKVVANGESNPCTTYGHIQFGQIPDPSNPPKEGASFFMTEANSSSNFSAWHQAVHVTPHKLNDAFLVSAWETKRNGFLGRVQITTKDVVDAWNAAGNATTSKWYPLEPKDRIGADGRSIQVLVLVKFSVKSSKRTDKPSPKIPAKDPLNNLELQLINCHFNFLSFNESKKILSVWEDRWFVDAHGRSSTVNNVFAELFGTRTGTFVEPVSSKPEYHRANNYGYAMAGSDLSDEIRPESSVSVANANVPHKPRYEPGRTDSPANNSGNDNAGGVKAKSSKMSLFSPQSKDPHVVTPPRPSRGDTDHLKSTPISTSNERTAGLAGFFKIGSKSKQPSLTSSTNSSTSPQVHDEYRESSAPLPKPVPQSSKGFEFEVAPSMKQKPSIPTMVPSAETIVIAEYPTDYSSQTIFDDRGVTRKQSIQSKRQDSQLQRKPSTNQIGASVPPATSGSTWKPPATSQPQLLSSMTTSPQATLAPTRNILLQNSSAEDIADSLLREFEARANMQKQATVPSNGASGGMETHMATAPVATIQQDYAAVISSNSAATRDLIRELEDQIQQSSPGPSRKPSVTRSNNTDISRKPSTIRTTDSRPDTPNSYGGGVERKPSLVRGDVTASPSDLTRKPSNGKIRVESMLRELDQSSSNASAGIERKPSQSKLRVESMIRDLDAELGQSGVVKVQQPVGVVRKPSAGAASKIRVDSMIRELDERFNAHKSVKESADRAPPKTGQFKKPSLNESNPNTLVRPDAADILDSVPMSTKYVAQGESSSVQPSGSPSPSTAVAESDPQPVFTPMKLNLTSNFVNAMITSLHSVPAISPTVNDFSSSSDGLSHFHNLINKPIQSIVADLLRFTYFQDFQNLSTLESNLYTCRINGTSLFKPLLKACVSVAVTDPSQIAKSNSSKDPMSLLSEEARLVLKAWGERWAVTDAVRALMYLDFVYQECKLSNAPIWALLNAYDDVQRKLKQSKEWLNLSERQSLSSILNDMHSFYKKEIQNYRQKYSKSKPTQPVESCLLVLRMISKNPVFRECHPELPTSFRTEIKDIMEESISSRFHRRREHFLRHDGTDMKAFMDEFSRMAVALCEDIAADAKYFSASFELELDITLLSATVYIQLFSGLMAERFLKVDVNSQDTRFLQQEVLAFLSSLKSLNAKICKISPKTPKKSHIDAFNVQAWLAPILTNWLNRLWSTKVSWMNEASKATIKSSEVFKFAKDVASFLQTTHAELKQIMEFQLNEEIRLSVFVQMFAKMLNAPIDRFCERLMSKGMLKDEVDSGVQSAARVSRKLCELLATVNTISDTLQSLFTMLKHRVELGNSEKDVDLWYRKSLLKLTRASSHLVSALNEDTSLLLEHALMNGVKKHNGIAKKGTYASHLDTVQFQDQTASGVFVDVPVLRSDAEAFFAPLTQHIQRILDALNKLPIIHDLVCQMWKEVLSIVEHAMVVPLEGHFELNRQILNKRQVSQCEFFLIILHDLFRGYTDKPGQVLDTARFEELNSLFSVYHGYFSRIQMDYEMSIRQGREKVLLLRLVRLRLDKQEDMKAEERLQVRQWFELQMRQRK